MTAYAIAFKRSAQRQLGRLPRQVQDQINDAIAGLALEPRPHGVAKLKGEIDRYRLRVGDYRIVYEIDDAARVLTVTTLGHRSVVYRHLSLLLLALR